MTSLRSSEGRRDLGLHNVNNKRSSSVATVTIRKYDLCAHKRKNGSTPITNDQDTTIEVPRSVLEARSPGSKPRMLLLQMDRNKKNEDQLKARSPGAGFITYQSKDSKKPSEEEMQLIQQRESRKPESIPAVAHSRPMAFASATTTTSGSATELKADSLKPSHLESRPTRSLIVEPIEAAFTLKGGMSSHILINESNVRLAIKIKTSNNQFFRVSHVYSFLDSGAMSELEIFRLPGGIARNDKLLLCYVVANDEDTNAKALFDLRAKIRNVTIKLTTRA